MKRPLQFVCPLEIRICEPKRVKQENDEIDVENVENQRDQRRRKDVAKRAKERINFTAMDGDN